MCSSTTAPNDGANQPSSLDGSDDWFDALDAAGLLEGDADALDALPAPRFAPRDDDGVNSNPFCDPAYTWVATLFGKNVSGGSAADLSAPLEEAVEAAGGGGGGGDRASSFEEALASDSDDADADDAGGSTSGHRVSAVPRRSRAVGHSSRTLIRVACTTSAPRAEVDAS